MGAVCKSTELCWRESCDFCLPKLVTAAENRGDTEKATRLTALLEQRRIANGVKPEIQIARGEDTPSSWLPVDLKDAVECRDILKPDHLKRSDGVTLLYERRVHWIQGESESLKSWLTQIAVAQVLTESEHNAVVYIDFEDDERGVTARLLALGVTADVLLDRKRFVYLRPDEPLYDRNGTALPGAVDLMETLDGFDFVNLAVIDGITEAMTTEGLSILDNADVARWMRRVPKLLSNHGAAVCCIDHLTKNRETQGRYAIGGVHKLNGVTGAVYKVTATKKLARADAEPVVGSSIVTVEKDRPGWVRSQADSDERIAVLEVTAYPDGGVTAALLPPDRVSTAPPWPLLDRILGHIHVYDGASKSAIENGVDGKTDTIRGALRWLVAEGWVEVEKVGAAHRHHITEHGRGEWEGRGEV